MFTVLDLKPLGDYSKPVVLNLIHDPECPGRLTECKLLVPLSSVSDSTAPAGVQDRPHLTGSQTLLLLLLLVQAHAWRNVDLASFREQLVTD